MDVRTRKNALREDLRRRRSALAEAEVRAASEAVCRHVAALPAFQRARLVAVYSSAQGEIDPAPLAQMVRSRGGTTVYPRVSGSGLAFCEVTDPSTMVAGAFGILAPRTELSHIDVARLELVIVPGVGFDPSGHRLGYGRGYYDAALATAPGALRVGLCHAFQVVDELPRREGDEPVDLIVTEHGVRKTGARPEVRLEDES